MCPISIPYFKFVNFTHIKTDAFHPVEHFTSPIFKIFFPIFGTDKIFNFHLFKFAKSENEISWCNFITESFTYLCYAERKFRMKSIHRVFEVYKYTLSGFGTKV